MKNNYEKLAKILQPYIDAVEGETGDYPELNEVLDKVVEWYRNSKRELREMDNDPRSDRYVKVKEILGEE